MIVFTLKGILDPKIHLWMFTLVFTKIVYGQHSVFKYGQDIQSNVGRYGLSSTDQAVLVVVLDDPSLRPGSSAQDYGSTVNIILLQHCIEEFADAASAEQSELSFLI